MHHLSGDELGDGEPDDVRGAVDIGDDAPDFDAREPARFGAKPQHDLVAVDCVDISPGSLDIVTGTVAVGPSCGGRTASRTAEPMA